MLRFLYDTSWTWQFSKIDYYVQRYEKTLEEMRIAGMNENQQVMGNSNDAVSGSSQHQQSGTSGKTSANSSRTSLDLDTRPDYYY